MPNYRTLETQSQGTENTVYSGISQEEIFETQNGISETAQQELDENSTDPEY
jgi:hypothetical protein